MEENHDGTCDVNFSSLTHTRASCVCMCQYNVYGVVTVCMQCPGFAVRITLRKWWSVALP